MKDDSNKVDAIAQRVVKALGTDPTQALVFLNTDGRPIWASESLFTLVDVNLAAEDPLADSLHPDDVSLCSDIFATEKLGVADTSVDMDRRFELQVRLRSPRGGWNVVALRLLNVPHDPEINGMLLQLTMVNQEHSTVEAFDAAALGQPLDQVLRLVLETLCSGGEAESQAAVFDRFDACIASTRGAGIEPGDSRTGKRWNELVDGKLDLSVPVTGPSEGLTIATLETFSNFPDVRPFTRALTARVARRIGLLLEADHAREELTRQADCDVLTGLYNRRALNRHLISANPPTYASVAFVDLNHFKSVNDRYGHAVGDEVLQEVARRLRSLARAEDFVARIGGDEFVLIRQSHSLEQCEIETAEMTAVLDGRLQIGPIAIEFSTSVGVATGRASETFELLANADVAMYSCKPDRRAMRRESHPETANQS
jgi:diguanylate cyclase (GGDEF)-like protein